MPNNLINKVCEVCSMPKDQVDHLWKRSEEIVEKQYKVDVENSKFYQLVVGVFKNAIGKDCSNKLNWQHKQKPVLEEIDIFLKYLSED